jgi:hypothetical protein
MFTERVNKKNSLLLFVFYTFFSSVNMPKSLFIFFLLSFSAFSAFSQKTITGIVSESLNQPHDTANLIAKPLQAKAGIKFAMADNKGRIRLEIDNEVKYEIVGFYISYTKEILTKVNKD